ncbi:ABC transporter ATP-binding protein [Caballeronia megalochromosomata]|nr:ABC transporter ATP-binding protein [Caballeronia megalochromosomata]
MNDVQSQTTDTRAKIAVQDLTKYFDVSPPFLSRLLNGQDRSVVKAVDGVSFSIPKGTTFSLVGESGCGKSTIARLVMGLYQPTSGSVEYDSAPAQQGKGRGVRKRMQMIFQDPFASLNPRWRVRDIVAEPLITYGLANDRQSVDRRVGELLEMVNLTAKDGSRYPHAFSGGQRQRISIARALASNPEFLVCDEPTSALDVSVQAQILNLMKDLQREFGLTYLFISHDLAVVHHISDYVGIMYLGRLVETGAAGQIFADPQHPYTQLLLQAIPDLKMSGHVRTPLRGEVPSPMSPPTGCHFHPRCPIANERCKKETPRPIRTSDVHELRCHAAEEGRLKELSCSVPTVQECAP